MPKRMHDETRKRVGAAVHSRDTAKEEQVGIASMVMAGLLAFALMFALGCKSTAPAAAAPAAGVQGTMNANGTFTPAPGQPAVATQPATSETQPVAAIPAQSGASDAAARDERRDERRDELARQQATAPVPPPAPVERTLPRDTRIPVRITESLAASRNNVGDGFTGVVAQDVVVDGSVFFSRGTRVSGTVVAAKGRGRFKGAGDLGIELTAIGGERVSSSEYEVDSKGKGRRTGEVIGGGAGLGAIIGAIAGGGKGAAIGAIAGGGGGAAAAAYTGNKDVVIPAESLITFRLLTPMTR
jgi:hypothetical protein